MSLFGDKNKGYLYSTSAEAPASFTTDFAVDDTYINATSHGLSFGDIVTVYSSGTLPAGLSASAYYSVLEVVSSSQFTLSLDGKTAVSFTSNGTGSHSFVARKTRTELDYYIILEDAPAEDGFIQKSVINGHREWVTKGYHWRYRVEINLLKYASDTLRKTQFKALHALLYTPVYLYRRIQSGEVVLLRDSSGIPVTFLMTEFTPGFVTQVNFEDTLIVGLTSQDYVDLSQTI